MKILFLNYEYPPLGGGAGVATEGLLHAWARENKHEVHLITSAVGDHIEHERIGGRVYLHRLPIGKNRENLHAQSNREILMYSLKTLWFLVPFLRRQQQSFDVTLAFFTLPCGFIAWLVKLFTGIPFVLSLRGADVPGFSEKYVTLYRFMKPLIRFLWRQAAAVVPNSVELMALARRTAPSQAMTIIENGVDTEYFKPRETKDKKDRVILLSVARLTPRKRLHTLIQAFAEAKKKVEHPMELRLVGDGEQLENLKQLVQTLTLETSVKFFGPVSHLQLPPIYQEADVFVLPSKNEGMSNSVLEALASGLPLLVSRTGGMQELVKEGENGFFINPDDLNQFSDRIVVLSKDEELRDQFGKSSRTQGEARSWKSVAETFIRVLEQRCTQ